MEEKTITITESELKRIEELAVLVSKVDDIEAFIPEIFASLKSMTKEIVALPNEITKCSQKMDKELKEYMHEEFVTNTEMKLFEKTLETKISRASWLISGAIAMGTIINVFASNVKFFS